MFSTITIAEKDQPTGILAFVSSAIDISDNENKDITHHRIDS